MRLAPGRFAHLYTMRELDMMLIIEEHETRQANEEVKGLCQTNRSS